MGAPQLLLPRSWKFANRVFRLVQDSHCGHHRGDVKITWRVIPNRLDHGTVLVQHVVDGMFWDDLLVFFVEEFSVLKGKNIFVPEETHHPEGFFSVVREGDRYKLFRGSVELDGDIHGHAELWVGLSR